MARTSGNGGADDHEQRETGRAPRPHDALRDHVEHRRPETEEATAGRSGAANKAAVLTRLARLVATADARQSLPERFAGACRRVLDVDAITITLESNTPERITLWSTSEDAARLEDLQDITGEGPSTQAFTTGQPVTTDLDGAEQRWPEFTAAARRIVGELAMFALPIRLDATVIGALTLYMRPPLSSAPSAEAAQFVADALGAALVADTPDPDHVHDESRLTGPWSNRAEVHQASGMVTAQLGLPPADALAIMRAHAFAHDTTLHDIAEQVLTTRLDFGSESSESL